MNKTGGKRQGEKMARAEGEELKCQKAKTAGKKKKIVVLVREDRNVDEYFKRQTKGNDTL